MEPRPSWGSDNGEGESRGLGRLCTVCLGSSGPREGIDGSISRPRMRFNVMLLMGITH